MLHPREQARIGAAPDLGADLPRHEPVAAVAAERRAGGRVGRASAARAAVSPTRRPSAVRHEARPVTVTTSATPRRHGLLSKVKNSTSSRSADQIRMHDWARARARRVRRAAEELATSAGVLRRDPDPADALVALDHVHAARGSEVAATASAARRRGAPALALGRRLQHLEDGAGRVPEHGEPADLRACPSPASAPPAELLAPSRRSRRVRRPRRPSTSSAARRPSAR